MRNPVALSKIVSFLRKVAPVPAMGGGVPSSKGQSTRRTTVVSIAVVLCFFIVVLNPSLFYRGEQHCVDPSAGAVGSLKPWEYNVTRDAGNYGLTEEQCATAFPKLYRPIEELIARLERPITLADTMGGRHWGEFRAMIYDNEIYVLDDWPDKIADNRKYATLHAINRAMVAVAPSGHRFPNIEFSLVFQDRNADLSRPNWAYSRLISDKSTMLIPDFGLYSWPAHNVGTYPEVRRKIKAVEESLRFEDKIAKLLWRGTVAFGAATREALLNASAGKPWSAAEGIEWLAPDYKDHMVTLHDHCRYKFLAQTEGLAYSGRLKYLHNCESVIIAHEPGFETHDQHLMIASGPQQNYVSVKHDFSDLSEKMDWLLAHPIDAARIAHNNVATFRDRYLTPAAEACYWRKLIHEWAAHSFEPEFFKKVNGSLEWRGVPYESFALQRALQWDKQKPG